MAEKFGADTPLKTIKSVPSGTAEKLKSVGIVSVGDILWHFPVRYEDWKNTSSIRQALPGKDIVIRGKLGKSFIRRIWRRKLSVTEAEIADNSGKIRAMWFNQPYVRYGFAEGEEIVASGKVSERNGRLFLLNPSYEIAGKKEHGKTGSIVPVYRRPKRVSSESIRKIVGKVINIAEKMPEFIPEKVISSQNIPPISEAIVKAHFPASMKEAFEAKRRFSFETLFLIQLMNRVSKKRLLEMKAPKIETDMEFVKSVLRSIPFELTFPQKKALWEILKDMSSGRPMNRLLQGDVGSGKTVVAAVAAIVAAKNGFQTAIMAPTEILAIQHYSTFKKMFPNIGISVSLVTSKISRMFTKDCLESETKRKDIADMIRNKKIDIVIGTHSLIAANKSGPLIRPENIGLVVIDEQHRFGVKERGKLGKRDSRSIPHFLSMSATPIPRTLAIALFGDLDMSFINELPKGRKRVVVKWVSPENRNKAYSFIRAEIAKGRQAFVICPKIETGGGDTEEIPALKKIWSDVKTVKKEYDRLSTRIFPEMSIGTLHGKMDSKEKEKVMASFKNGEISLLVCTSVVEVGIDVPNATIMIIEDADRFGLAQLYQFKGRVGRGECQSYCLMFSGAPSETAKDRLKALSEAKNGLELAERDLALRGPGEFLGQNQKGLPDITMKALRDKELIKASKEAADMVIEKGILIDEFAPLKTKLDALRDQFHPE